VRFLLISGQASILYGAATFSEDVDLWVEPTSTNIKRLIRALAALQARVYKFTPPITVRNMRRGHGFHFLAGDLFLDIMGRPPRVGSFLSAWRRRRMFDTEWGRMAVVCPEDLVLLKKTRRRAD
jgi:hypothetical protein